MNDPLVLALETSSRRGSVALGRGGDPGAIRSKVLQADRTHTAELHPAVATLLSAAQRTSRDVELIAFSQGPGSFTGLRVAATFAGTWRSACGAGVVGVCSLDAIAHAASRHPAPPRVLAVLVDARQGRGFAAQYERSTEGRYACIAAPQLVDVQSWIEMLDRETVLTGEGITAAADAIAACGLATLASECWLPDAVDVLVLAAAAAARGELLAPDAIVPRYIRKPECEEVYEARRAAAIERRTATRSD